jgi:hypothetical protein
MSFSETLTATCSMGGQSQVTRTGDAKVPIVKTLPAGVAGDVDEVVEATTVLNVASGHGITDADLVGVFWDGAQDDPATRGLRLGMTVTAYTSTTITVTTATGTGDALPSTPATDLVVSLQTVEDDVSYDGTAAKMLSIVCSKRAGVEMLDALDASVLAAPIHLPAPASGSEGESFLWADGAGYDNPMTDAVASTVFYNGSTVAASLVMGVLVE